MEVRGTRSMTNPDIKRNPTAWKLVRNWKFDREGPDEWNPSDERAVWAIGVATLRLDGFVCLEAKDEPGTVVTKSFKLEGDNLQVNVKGGEVLVEVLDRKGEPMPGFSAKEATKYKDVDELRLAPTWNSGSRLSTLKGSVIRLEFHLENASILVLL